MRKTKRTIPAKSAHPDVNQPLKKIVNLFTGNIDELIEKLNLVPDYIAEKYLKIASEPNVKIAHSRLLAGDAKMFERYLAAAKNEKLQGFSGKEYVMETEGLFFDVSTFLTGQPECWVNEIDTQVIGKAKDIKINIAAPHWVTEKNIFEKLIKVVEVIDKAEATGQRLSITAILYGTDGYQSNHNDFIFEVQIKKESEPINIQQLVYLFATPILLRYAALTLQQAANMDFNPCSSITFENAQIGREDYLYIPSISYDHENNICYKGGKTFDYSTLDIVNQYNLNLS